MLRDRGCEFPEPLLFGFGRALEQVREARCRDPSAESKAPIRDLVAKPGVVIAEPCREHDEWLGVDEPHSVVALPSRHTEFGPQAPCEPDELLAKRARGHREPPRQRPSMRRRIGVETRPTDRAFASNAQPGPWNPSGRP